jgi:dUTP pyrophosphatase
MTTDLSIPVRFVRKGSRDLLPRYQTVGSSGMDLRADIEGEIIIPPLSRTLTPTGISAAIPPGVEGQVRPRSGLAIRSGITCLNSPGTIDSDFRGEICVVLANFGEGPFSVRRGDRIAQLVFTPVVRATWQEVESLEPTPRGGGGFGHTG